MKLLNIGCGSTYHKDWVNIDIQPASSSVHRVDFSKGLPFENQRFDAVYHSHVLEHIPRSEAPKFIKENLRVLKPNGILRIAVPDLEQITRLYLAKLQAASDHHNPESRSDYDWIMLELLDQTVRNYSGGEMAAYLSNPKMINKDFVVSRIGLEAEGIFQNQRIDSTRLTPKKIIGALKKIRTYLSYAAVLIIGGRSRLDAYKRGLFRSSGEVHQWMYDRYSLTALLSEAGLSQIKIMGANESRIPNFNGFELEAINGKIKKPDSLFIEGVLN